ncbi:MULTISPECIES: DUF6126 family protein [Kitasatospora]|uniref:DUF6126 family protein n=1 Tax=Kitasatospora cathayae TaxID=3004092 RepID=A0ABY7Q4N9_9ACTN|nr:DUF6126 family protein [Kitasatospora sp. HUAS 3-15]WBP87596.1 DUF6126 family protein [Kitasatospora sp. HUAS 3-15]
MADPTTTATPAAAATAPVGAADTSAGPKTMDAGKWANKRVYLRLVIYTAGIHAFAGFIMLLFELGNRNK